MGASIVQLLIMMSVTNDYKNGKTHDSRMRTNCLPFLQSKDNNNNKKAKNCGCKVHVCSCISVSDCSYECVFYRDKILQLSAALEV